MAVSIRAIFSSMNNRGDSRTRLMNKLSSVLSPGLNTVSEKALSEIWTGEKLKTLRKTRLPIDEGSCSACTRHFYQNNFMNEVWQILEKGKRYGIAEHVLKEYESGDSLDF
jgi:hypothetical protein